MNDFTTNNLEIRDIVVTRTLDTPLELVWKAWTDPKYVMRWWGPKDYTSPSCKIDFREGGTFLFCMRAPEYQGGQDYYSAGVYKKIVPMEMIEFVQSLADKDGNKIDPAQLGLKDFPKEVRTVILFKAKGGKTEMTVTEYDWPVGQMFDNSVTGLNQSMDKLVDSLADQSSRLKGDGSMSKHNRATIIAEPGKQEFVITREFEAPRELVFKAYTDPELYVQ